jgi:hypothetical protein
MHDAREFSSDRRAEILDLFIGNRSPLSFTSHESEHTRGSQYLKALLNGLNHVDERITAKHWHFNLAPPVAPSMDLMENWKKGADSLALELSGNPLLMPWHGMNRVPV